MDDGKNGKPPFWDNVSVSILGLLLFEYISIYEITLKVSLKSLDWQNGKMAKWGKCLDWQNGKMAKWANFETKEHGANIKPKEMLNYLEGGSEGSLSSCHHVILLSCQIPSYYFHFNHQSS